MTLELNYYSILTNGGEVLFSEYLNTINKQQQTEQQQMKNI